MIEHARLSGVVLLMLLAGCTEPVRLAERERVRVTNDSEAVERMIFAEGDLQARERSGRTRAEWEEVIRAETFEGREAPRRREFLKKLASEPGFDLDSATDAKVVQTVADCRCTLRESYGNAMDKIRIASGSFAGRVGWICDDRVRRLRMWP